MVKSKPGNQTPKKLEICKTEIQKMLLGCKQGNMIATKLLFILKSLVTLSKPVFPHVHQNKSVELVLNTRKRAVVKKSV